MIETNFDPTRRGAEGIHPHLDDMEPGPVLAAFLSAIDVTRISGYDRIVVLRAHQRLASHYQAHIYTDMAAVTDAMSEIVDSPGYVAEAAAAEIRSALTMTRAATDRELSFALDMRQRLPKLADMLSSGVIDVRRAKTIEHGTCHLSIGAARGVLERIAEAAPNLTTGQLAHRITKLCIEANPHEAQERYKRAIEDREIVARPTVDGTATLTGYNLEPDRVAAATRRINQIARTLRGGAETRTMDQLRADVYLDLLNGTQIYATNTPRSGVVDITVDLDTLAGLTDHPGELNGFSPVIADIARQVVVDQPDAEWRYTVTDTETNQPLHTGITSRRPTADVRRAVQARDRTCVFPGCRMPAIDADLDHRTTYAEGGQATEENLAPLCRHDHCIRHQAGWTYQPLPHGRYQWTSRLGHTYTTTRAPP